MRVCVSNPIRIYSPVVGECTPWPPVAPPLSEEEKKKQKAELWKFIKNPPQEDELDDVMYHRYPPAIVQTAQERAREDLIQKTQEPKRGKLDSGDIKIRELLENVIQYGEDKPPEERLPTPSKMNITLLPHQQLGVEWMLSMEKGTNKGGILADDMGLGKTVQSIGIICANPPNSRERRPTLILCPVSLMDQVIFYCLCY